MRGLGERLKERTRELGLTDSDVARRLGLSQARYSHYANDLHEPDLETLVRITQVLGISADRALGLAPSEEGGADGALRARLDVAKRALGERGPVWWSDGEPDYNRRMVANTPYAAWHARKTDCGDATEF